MDKLRYVAAWLVANPETVLVGLAVAIVTVLTFIANLIQRT